VDSNLFEIQSERVTAELPPSMTSFSSLLADVRACTICKDHLPLGPRPVLQMHPKARILIAGQAPGRKVHDSGVPFDDPSGKRLREWLGVTREVFYDPKQIALLPMGFCYPGSARSGDLPPRPECAPAWRQQLLAKLQHVQLTLVLGRYAQSYHFGKTNVSLTELVRSWRSYWPDMIPLPHPSPRNNLWLRRNPWFDAEVVPALRQQVAEILQ
jgi:uracil-DNA glycosylase